MQVMPCCKSVNLSAGFVLSEADPRVKVTWRHGERSMCGASPPLRTVRRVVYGYWQQFSELRSCLCFLFVRNPNHGSVPGPTLTVRVTTQLISGFEFHWLLTAISLVTVTTVSPTEDFRLVIGERRKSVVEFFRLLSVKTKTLEVNFSFK